MNFPFKQPPAARIRKMAESEQFGLEDSEFVLENQEVEEHSSIAAEEVDAFFVTFYFVCVAILVTYHNLYQFK